MVAWIYFRTGGCTRIFTFRVKIHIVLHEVEAHTENEYIFY